ncbi:MAG: hypothetical protein DWH78_09555 [Planctomycetota bacterium]|jgi:hypothetical protein|nr:MAG: hypothetical protein DWH78_09555 [Planctomycetota bacterium]
MPGKLARGDNRTGPRQFALNGIPQGTDSFREAVANYQVGGKNEVKNVLLSVTATVTPLQSAVQPVFVDAGPDGR